MLKRFLGFFLCCSILLGYLSVPVSAEDCSIVTPGAQQLPHEDCSNTTGETDVPVALQQETKTVSVQLVPETDLPDNADLFCAFVERELYDYHFSTFGVTARSRLNPVEQHIYDNLKAKIETVALSGGSTVFSVSDISGLKTSWTNTELAVSSIDDYAIAENAFEAQFSAAAIMDALLADCPFDLYWFDKTFGVAINYGLSRSGYTQGSVSIWDSVTITNLHLTFAVSKDFRTGANVVSSNVSRVTAARNNAAQVVLTKESKSNLEKMTAYKEYICSAVSYDYVAADNPATPYGNPWQLISVFDGDSSTNVVCEGYAKAFQYLCDLSDLDCISVGGKLVSGSGSEGHMWNVVMLDGKKYLVDVTNCDGDSDREPNPLFLVGTPYQNGSYGFDCGYQILYFYCDDLGLATENYPLQTPPAHKHNYTSAVTVPTCKDQGYSTHTCSCGDSYVDSYTNATGVHSYVNYVCKHCGAIGGTCGGQEDGKNLVWTYENKTLTISGIGSMADYGLEECPWSSYRNDLLYLEISDGVTSIGSCTFEKCTELTEVVLPNSVTEINSAAFGECTKLSKVTLSENITILTDGVFRDCVSLTNIAIPSGVTTIGNSTFSGCSSLTEIVIPGTVEKVLPYAFGKCSSLKEVTFEGNLPDIWEGDPYQYGSLAGCELIAYYPADNSTWTSDKLHNYGGVITWIPYCTEHVEVIDESIPATCTEPGLTEGKHCIVCNTVTAAQQTIAAKGHTEKMIPGKAVQCYEPGLTDGKMCSVCDETLLAQEEISAPGKHTFAQPEDAFCSVCGEIRSVPLFRMYDPNGGEHFYTGSEEERDNLIEVGWNYEGVGFNFPVAGEPVYRLYHKPTGEHLYTMDIAEREKLLSKGWNDEGVAFNSAGTDQVPQYRLHNPNEERGSYHFTGSIEERDWLMSLGWQYQGIGWYSCWT